MDLMNMPFNLVHELYRIVFIKIQLQREEEEKRKKEDEEKQKLEEQKKKAEEEALRTGTPAFVPQYKPYQSPPQEKPREPVQGEGLAQQLIANDMTDMLEEVIS